jgi:hypothetical protein
MPIDEIRDCRIQTLAIRALHQENCAVLQFRLPIFADILPNFSARNGQKCATRKKIWSAVLRTEDKDLVRCFSQRERAGVR